MEVWKTIPFATKYRVSNFGRVIGIRGKILSTRKNQSGYTIINIHVDTDNILRTYFVHKLVMETFVGKRKHGETINHKDGNKNNNHLNNLEYMSHLDNMRHAFENGLIPKDNFLGIKNPKHKLSEKDVKKIRKLYASGKYKQSELGKMFFVDQTQISCIVLRKNWKHIE